MNTILYVFGIIFCIIFYSLCGAYIIDKETDGLHYGNKDEKLFESLYWKLLKRQLKILCKEDPEHYEYINDIHWYYKDPNKKQGVLAMIESPDISRFDSILLKLMLFFWPIVFIIEFFRFLYYIKFVNKNK